MVTAMCLRHSGSQRTDRHQGARGIEALWEMASLWPFWTCQAIYPMCCLLLSSSFFSSHSLCEDHRAALKETNHLLRWSLTSAGKPGTHQSLRIYYCRRIKAEHIEIKHCNALFQCIDGFTCDIYIFLKSIKHFFREKLFKWVSVVLVEGIFSL